MLIQTYDTLRPLFEKPPVFLFDQSALFEEAKSIGLECVLLDQHFSKDSFAKGKSGVVFVISDREPPEIAELAPALGSRNVLHIPTYAFDGSLPCTRYTLQKCSGLDLVDCVERNKRVINELQKAKANFSLESDKSTVRFSLLSEIRILGPMTSLQVPDGMDCSIAAYTEVALVPNQMEGPQLNSTLIGYQLSGEFLVDGCLVAIHRGVPAAIVNAQRRLVAKIDEIRSLGGFPIRLAMEDSTVTRISDRQGNDLLEIFLGEMHPFLGANVLELAVGTNAAAQESELDWSYNSPYNESALGFHIGIGDGALCPHIDFICCSNQSYDNFHAQI